VKPGSPAHIDALVALRDEALTCRKCSLAAGRSCVVFGTGNIAQPPIAFVGEAPGQEEDVKGVPFVGRAGKILNEFIVWAGFTREQVYVLNPVLCRPPGNRQPTEQELQACRPYFDKQLELVQPKVIVALGRVATTAVLDTVIGMTGTLGSLRGVWHESASLFQDAKIRVTYHPAYIARNPAAKVHVYEDFRAVRAYLDKNP